MKGYKLIRSIAYWLLVGISVSMVLFTAASVLLLDRADRDLFGYRAFVILSDSMEKTDFAAGDLILVRTVDPATLREGDIISFVSENAANFGQTVTHKIRRRVTDTGGQSAFITYGTTNDVDDATAVSASQILGKYVHTIPNLGRFFLFLRSTPGYLVCILLPFLALIFVELFRCMQLVRRYRTQQRNALRAERMKLARQRAETEQLLLKLQLLHDRHIELGESPTKR